ncbi:hypothetical protein VNO77_03458 [Canavalia gladiata]|uniref:Uncharacterized protein n=1 Tax=Canavalia gladiata TaxID=3824 RepID=A0AAN9R6W0_CANGL
MFIRDLTMIYHFIGGADFTTRIGTSLKQDQGIMSLSRTTDLRTTFYRSKSSAIGTISRGLWRSSYLLIRFLTDAPSKVEDLKVFPLQLKFPESFSENERVPA